MPTNHGLHRSVPEGLPPGTRLAPEQIARFRWGIYRVFETLRVGPHLTNPEDKIRVSGLATHFREITRRFVFSLQHLNTLMQEMAVGYERIDGPMFVLGLMLEAGCQADHVLTYLNAMLDDIAHCIVFATGLVAPNPKRPIDSMGGLKREDIRSLPALAPVRSLLAELDDANSWWEIGFKAKIGARQLLIHNQHVVEFQGSKAPGCAMQAQAFLVAPFGQTALARDFFELLRDLLSKLCDWLDRLESILSGHLPPPTVPSWRPRATMAEGFHLPVGFPVRRVQFSELYFPLPLCDGSDPLPWSIAPPHAVGS